MVDFLPTFRITTYWKVPKGESGIRQLGSQHLNVVQAFEWLINAVPEESIDIEEMEETTTLTIHWNKMAPSLSTQGENA